MSQFSSQGLCINLYKPLITRGAMGAPLASYIPNGQHIAKVDDDVSSYGHVVSASLGYESAQFNVACDQVDAERWLEVGLNLHVQTTDESGVTVWEGFVNQLQVVVGAMTLTYGPLLEIANRAILFYNRLDTSTRPPTSFEKAWTPLLEMAASIDLYGINYKSLEGTNLTPTTAVAICNFWLSQLAWPQRPMAVNLSGEGGDATVTFDCLGYGARLNYPYSQVALSGTANISTILATVLNADPNVLFASTNADITVNTIQVKRYENDGKDALTLIKYLLSMGDATNNRYRFMIGPDRRITYAAAPTWPEYRMQLGDSTRQIRQMAGDLVKPWNVQPGKWLVLSDYLVGTSSDEFASLDADPRTRYINAINFTAPWDLQLETGLVNRIDQKLAQMGLSGR